MSRILIVDDDEQLGRSVARLLGRERHETEFADELGAALEKSVDVDLVIIELQDGWLERLADFRARLDARGAQHVPFIVTTGRRESFRRLGEVLGLRDDLLTKPFDAEELAARVQVALRRGGDTMSAERTAADEAPRSRR